MRLQARVDKLEQYDAQRRISRQIRVVYGDDEPTEVLPGDVVLRVRYADDPHGPIDLPSGDRP